MWIILAGLVPLLLGLAAVPLRQQGLTILAAVQSMIEPFHALSVPDLHVDSSVCGIWQVLPDPNPGYGSHQITVGDAQVSPASDLWAVGRNFTCFGPDCWGNSRALIMRSD